MPVFPDAPGTFETGSATPGTGWARLEICRAIVSAPPPVPHVQMISIGRLGNFSCAATWLTATASRTHASVRTLIVDLPTAVPGSGRLPQQAAQHLARRGLRKRVAELDDPRDLVRGEPRPAELRDLGLAHAAPVAVLEDDARLHRLARSEERRVGKSVDLGGRRI